jgi:hypothetical protein
MINRESTSILGSHRFIARQLVFTRLHSRHWLWILLFGLSLSVISVLIPSTLVASVIDGDVLAAMASGTLAVVWTVAVTVLENRIARLFQGAQQTFYSQDRQLLPRLAAVFTNYGCQILSVLVSGIAFVSASSTRRLEWRGISYRIRRSQVTLVRYQPFAPAHDADSALHEMSI